jgi:hypothetical protein
MAGTKKAPVESPIDDTQAGAGAEYQEDSEADRLGRLKSIRDKSLRWWQKLVENETARGTLAAKDSYEAALKDLRDIKEGTEGSTGIEVTIAGFDPSKIVYTKDSRPDSEPEK